MTTLDLKRLEGVHPKLVQAVTTILGQQETAGAPMFVAQGLRTADYQHDLFLQGRPYLPGGVPGRIVTDKDGYLKKSNHQAHSDGYGYAVDLAFIPSKAVPNPWDRNHPWNDFGARAETLGLVWGGGWKGTLQDLDHVELRPTV